jgi:hypothetical protein
VTRKPIGEIIDGILNEDIPRLPDESDAEYRERVIQKGREATKLRVKEAARKAREIEREPVGKPIKAPSVGGGKKGAGGSRVSRVDKEDLGRPVSDVYDISDVGRKVELKPKKKTVGGKEGAFAQAVTIPPKAKDTSEAEKTFQALIGVIRDATGPHMDGWNNKFSRALATSDTRKNKDRKQQLFNRIRDEYWDLLEEPLEELDEQFVDSDIWGEFESEFEADMAARAAAGEAEEIPPSEWEKAYKGISPGQLDKATELRRKLYGDDARGLPSQLEEPGDPNRSLQNLASFINNSYNATTGDAVWKTRAEREQAEKFDKVKLGKEQRGYYKDKKTKKMFGKTPKSEELKQEFRDIFSNAVGETSEDKRRYVANMMGLSHNRIESFIARYPDDEFVQEISGSEGSVSESQEKLKRIIEEALNYSVAYIDHSSILMEDGVDRLELNLVGSDYLETSNGLIVEIEGISSRMRTLAIDEHDVNAIQDAIVDWRYNEAL